MIFAIGGFILGLAVGGVSAFFIFRKREDPVGCLMMNCSDPDGPYLFLKLYGSPDIIAQRQHVILDVDITDQNSQR